MIEVKDIIKEVARLNKASATIRGYANHCIASLSRDEYEALRLAERMLDQMSFRLELKAIIPEEGADNKESHADNWLLPNPSEVEALDEYETTRLWAKSEPRYWVQIIVDKVDGLPDVEVCLFHEVDSMPKEEMEALVVIMPGKTLEDAYANYTPSVIEETFSKAELRQLHEYFKWIPCVRKIRARRATAPDNHSVGQGAVGVSRGEDWIEFTKHDCYSLPFQVVGFYSLRDRWGEYMALKEAKE